MTSKQLAEENATLFNGTHRLLKKYLAIKQIVKTLHVRKKMGNKKQQCSTLELLVSLLNIDKKQAFGGCQNNILVGPKTV